MKWAIVALITLLFAWGVSAEQRFQGGGSGSAVNLASDGEIDADKAANAADSRLDLQALGLRLVDGKWQGNEQTYAYVCSAKTFKALDDLQTWTDVYADVDAADDSGNGLTPGTAKKTLAAASGISGSNCGRRINLAAGKTWTGAAEIGGSAGSGWAFAAMSPTCEYGVWIRSTDPDNPAIIDCDADGTMQDVIRNTAASVNRRVYTENVHITNCLADAYDTTNAAEHVILRGHADVTGGANNVLTTHGTSNMWAIQTGGSSTVTGTANTQTVAPTANSSMGLLCPGEYHLENEGTGTSSGAFIALNNVRLNVVGPTFTSAHGTVNARLTEINPATGESAKAVMARSHMEVLAGGSGGAVMRIIASGSNESADVELYQTTIKAAAGKGFEIPASNVDGTSSWSLFARGLLIDDIPSFTIETATNGLTYGSVDIRRSIYDDTDTANTFRFDGTNYETLAAAQAAATGWRLWDDDRSLRVDDTDPGGGDQTEGAPPLHPNICGYGKACHGLLAEEYVVDFGVHPSTAEPLCLPPGILPVPVCSLRLGGLTADAGFTVANDMIKGITTAEAPALEPCTLPGELPCELLE